MGRFQNDVRCVLLLAGVLAGGVATAEAPLHLKTRDLETSVQVSSSRLSPLKRRAEASSHLLVQFEEAPQPEQLQELERRGAKVLRAAPESGVMATVDDGAFLHGLGISWVGRLEPEDKISPLLTALVMPWEVEGYFVVEFHPDVDMADARALAEEHNLAVTDHPDLLPHHLLVRGMVDQLWRLSQWDEVAYIFPASEDLASGARVMACEGASTAEGLVGQYIAKVGEGWDGPGLNAAELGYYFQALTNKLSPDVAQTQILRAFSQWARYVQLTFRPANSPVAVRTINVLFASGAHGDAYPFDGPGGTLAHTFYPAPPNPEPIAGDMHFDADENWHNGQDVDVFSVALHESGHALGLAHSDRPGDVMYPYYRKVTGLSDNDIASIRTLYAAQDTPPQDQPPQPAPLTIQILSPAGSPVTTSAVSLVISGTVSGGTGTPQATWASDRGPSGAATGSPSWIILVVPLSAGNNVITVTAADTAQARASASVFITRQVEVVPVSLAITSPAPGGSYASSTSTVTLAGTASHPAGITRVAWTNSRGGNGVASGTNNWSAGPISLAAGANLNTVTAYETGGTSASESLTVTYAGGIKDTVAPSLRITSPGSTNVVTSASAITLSGTASDNVGVAQVSWITSTGKSGVATGTTLWTAANIPLLIGANAITVRAGDAAGNVSWRAIIVTRR